MIRKGVKLYKIKYVQQGKNETQWSVGVLAMGWEDAEGFLRTQMGDIRVEERGGTFNIDTMTPTCLIEPDPIIKEVEVIKEVTVPAEDGKPTCPWCGKQYKSLKTLETHIKKAHFG